jgi:hypothetical protein
MKREKSICQVREELIRKHARYLAEAKRQGLCETEDSKRALQEIQGHNNWGHDGNRCPAN